MKISNLAICMYGQYRSGDVCIPHIKSIIHEIEVDNIDIFCSVKNTISFHTNDGSVTPTELNNLSMLNEEQLDAVSNFINHQLSPVSLNFLADSVSTLQLEERNIRPDFLVFTGIIDSLLLKQKHEAASGVFYDAVILLRYDFVMSPLQYIAKFIEKIKSSDDLKIWANDPDLFFTVITNDALLVNQTNLNTLFNESINDFLIMFTGSAADRLCYELIDIVHKVTPIYANSVISIYDNYRDLYDCHVLLSYLSNRISLKLVDAPAVSSIQHDKNLVLSSIPERINSRLSSKPMLAIVRPSEISRQSDPSTNEGFDQLMNQWIVESNNKYKISN